MRASRLQGFSYASGVHALGTAIWCDAARARGVCFVSRGDAPVGRGRAERVIATAQTAAIRRALGEACADPLLPRFGRPFALGRARLELLPSGRLPGGAQLLVELGAWRGLYAGAVAPEPLVGAEPLQVRACDELVLDAPQAGGIIDGVEQLTRLARDANLVFAVDDVAVLLAIAEQLGSAALELAPTWRKLGEVFSGFGARGKGKARRATRIRVERLRTDRGPRRGGAIEVRLGSRLREEVNVLALGLAPDAGTLAGYASDTGARRVHVRMARPSTLELAGAEALIAALAARAVAAEVLGPPEQLSLFPDGVAGR